jgi:hypothetical protein
MAPNWALEGEDDIEKGEEIEVMIHITKADRVVNDSTFVDRERGN